MAGSFASQLILYMEVYMDRELLKTTKEKLSEIADVLYKNNVNLGMAKMVEAIPLLAAISTTITDMDMQTRLVNDGLAPALEAMEDKDSTLLADIITYEIIAVIEDLINV